LLQEHNTDNHHQRSAPSGRTVLLAGLFRAPDCGDAQTENVNRAELEAAQRVG